MKTVQMLCLIKMIVILSVTFIFPRSGYARKSIEISSTDWVANKQWLSSVLRTKTRQEKSLKEIELGLDLENLRCKFWSVSTEKTRALIVIGISSAFTLYGAIGLIVVTNTAFTTFQMGIAIAVGLTSSIALPVGLIGLISGLIWYVLSGNIKNRLRKIKHIITEKEKELEELRKERLQKKKSSISNNSISHLETSKPNLFHTIIRF